jgi:hypothetical protein
MGMARCGAHVLFKARWCDKDGEEASQGLFQLGDVGVFGLVCEADFFGVFLDGGDEALGERSEGVFVVSSQGEGDKC